MKLGAFKIIIAFIMYFVAGTDVSISCTYATVKLSQNYKVSVIVNC